MFNKKSWLIAIVVLSALAFALAPAYAQRVSMEKAPNGDYAASYKMLEWSRQGTIDTLSRIKAVSDTTVAPHFYTFGADVIGLTMIYTNGSADSGEDLIIQTQGSFDGRVWSTATAIDTITYNGPSEVVAYSGSTANANGIGVSDFSKYKYVRFIILQDGSPATTDSSEFKLIPHALFKSR